MSYTSNGNCGQNSISCRPDLYQSLISQDNKNLQNAYNDLLCKYEKLCASVTPKETKYPQDSSTTSAQKKCTEVSCPDVSDEAFLRHMLQALSVEEKQTIVSAIDELVTQRKVNQMSDQEFLKLISKRLEILPANKKTLFKGFLIGYLYQNNNKASNCKIN